MKKFKLIFLLVVFQFLKGNCYSIKDSNYSFDTVYFSSASGFESDKISIYLDGICINDQILSTLFTVFSGKTLTYQSYVIVPKGKLCKISIVFSEFNFEHFPIVWLPNIDFEIEGNKYFTNYSIVEFILDSRKGKFIDLIFNDFGLESIPCPVNTKNKLPRKRFLEKVIQY